MNTTLWEFAANLTLWQAALCLLLWFVLRAAYVFVCDAYRLARARNALKAAREHAETVTATVPPTVQSSPPTERQKGPAHRVGYQA